MSEVFRVAEGLVRGREEAGIAVCLGLPYASLPHRFGPPVSATPWDGVRDCDRFGPPPPQPPDFGMAQLAQPGPADEWLSVNVWTPDRRGGLPVMVWIQGGAYTFGTSGLPEYDGANLARQGVVVVTLNYRVGFEGFGLLPQAPANRGLLDQVAALEWVRDNIAAFGGDPGRVTVFGQSAGGGSIAALLAMPRAGGLFSRAVVQSMPGTYFTPALAADVATECAAEIGLTPGDLATVDPHVLPTAGAQVAARLEGLVDRWGAPAVTGVLFAPVVDGEVLPSTPWQGVRGDVDLLVGHTRHEERLLSLLTGRLGTVTQTQAALTTDLLAPDPAAYRAAFSTPGELDEVVRSDWLFRMPSVALADAQLAAGGSTHVYELTWTAPGMGGALGACHGLDVPLVFGNLTVGQTALLLGESTGPGEAASALSRQLQSAWVRFAETGDPGWPGWQTGLVRLFDVDPRTVAYPETVSHQIWKDTVPAVCDLR